MSNCVVFFFHFKPKFYLQFANKKFRLFILIFRFWHKIEVFVTQFHSVVGPMSEDSLNKQMLQTFVFIKTQCILYSSHISSCNITNRHELLLLLLFPLLL